MPPEFIASAAAEPDTAAPAMWFVFRGAEVLIGTNEDGDRRLPLEREVKDVVAEIEPLTLGTLDGQLVQAGETSAELPPPEGFSFVPLNRLFKTIEPVMYDLAGRAAQIVEWNRTHRYCGRCGSETVRSEELHARTCPNCELVRFPRVDPSVLVLVERDGKALLARNETYAEGSFEVLAGFVDPGETLEDAIRREVREEVGIEIDDIRYFGSQPWPFPHGLMMAFIARWASGEIEKAKGEIIEAGWFAPDELPELPSRLSIARTLVDDFVHRNR